MKIGRWNLLLGLLLAWPAGAMAQSAEYEIVPAATSIGFATDVVDTFTVDGHFTRFFGTLILDLKAPEASRVEVEVQTDSFDIGWEPAFSLLRSDAYLDVAHWPKMHFVTRSVTLLDDHHVRLDGDLTIRGITHPQSLDAVLEQKLWDPDKQAEVAVFSAKGIVHRGEYAMTSDPLLVSNDVRLDIRARLKLMTP